MTETWPILRDSGLAPRVWTEHTSTAHEMKSFEAGARMLGLHDEIRGRSIKPQQLRTADTLNSGRRFGAVLEPRRSSKTSSILAWALGRCIGTTDFRVAYTTATTGKAARLRFVSDVIGPLERRWPDRRDRPMQTTKSAGMERVMFPNGSVFQVVGPHGDDFRGESYDVIIVDEAGEADPSMSEELLQVALPTQDTRPAPLFVAAGTAGNLRDGNLLWTMLERGRGGDPRVAIIEYSAGLDLVVEDIETWEQTVPLLERSHPGVGTLTSLDLIRDNYDAMERARFAREYLGVFGTVGMVTGIIHPAKWQEATELGEMPEPPDHFVLGIAVATNQAVASIVAAWRDEAGRACLLQLDRREGVTWLGQRVAELLKRYGRRVPIVHDDRGPVLAEVEGMSRMVPRPTFVKQSTREVTTAAALLVREVHTGNLRHWGQDGLTRAAVTAKRRDIGQAWGFGRPEFDSDITGIEAASLALRHFDETPRRRPLPRMTA